MKREDRKKKKEQIVKSMKKKEKKAALVIERFFITIKAEIEREIDRLAQKPSTKKKKGQRRHHSSGKTYHTTGASLLGASSAVEPNPSSFTFNNSSRETSSLSYHQTQNSVRNASPSRGRMPPIQSVNSFGDERVNAPAHHQQIPLVHSHSMGHPSQSGAHHSFNSTPQHHHDMRSASPSRSRVPTNQSVGQLSHRIPAIQSGGYAQRTSSAPRARMPPMQSVVQQQHHGGYTSNPAHAPSPSYGIHHPHYTPYNNANSQHAPMQHQTPRGPYQQQSHSYASAPHHHHPNQMHGPPLTSTHQHPNYHHAQYQRHNPPLTSSNQANPLQGQQYHEHQRPPSQSQTPMQSSQRQYQKGYNRY